MPSRVQPVIFRSIPRILVGSVLAPAVATTAVGILILALGNVPGSVALGVLTICFAVFALAGTVVTLALLFRQNRLARAQAEFLARVSHELRTPMTSIRMYVETLQMGRVRTEAERAACLAALERETARLAALVEQLLGFRASRDGGWSDEVTAVDVELAVGDTLAPFRQRPGHGERIAVVIEPQLPPARASARGLLHALTNLVDNALIHGGDGPIVVTARAEGQGVAIDVRDGGPGVPLGERERIFEGFERGAAALEAGKPGLGLGLSVVKQLAASCGGRVSVREAPLRGAVFTLWLPAASGLPGEGQG
jgi:two-component system phosphate regulon sensor histidine kinase PhoR